MIKKIMAIVLVSGLLFASGCGKTTQSDGEIPVLNFYMLGERPNDLTVVLEEANKILVDKIGAKMNMSYIDQAAYTERMNMNMASGDNYDLCFVGYVNPFVNAVQNGGLLAIDEYLKETTALTGSLPDYVFEIGKFNDKIYAIPNFQIMASCTALYIYKDLADAYGLDTTDIEKLGDIEPFLAWVKANRPEIFPFQTGGGGGLFGKIPHRAEEFARGISVAYGADGSLTVVPSIDTDGSVAEINLMRDWYEKGYIRQDISLVTDQTQDEKAGKYACWRATYKPGAEAEYKAVRNADVISIQLTEGLVSSTQGRNTMLGVGANSGYPQLAVKLIEQLNTNKELYNLIAFGIEGVHYNFTENNKVRPKENSGYNPGMTWRFGNQFNAYLLEDQEEGIWEDTINFNNQAKKSGLLGFTFDIENVKTEIAQISRIYTKYPSIKTGAEPPENYLSAMKDELYKAGIENVINEAQRQIDEWRENNK